MDHQKLNNIEVRKNNRNLIYKYIFHLDSGKACKQQIAADLGLSLPTVTHNLNELFERGLIRDVGVFESTGGRKARAIALNARARHAIGLDVTRNHVGVVVVDLRGNIIGAERFRFPFSSSRSYFKGIAALLEKVVSDNGIDPASILGVGIAVPAIVSENGTKMTYAALLDYTTSDLSDFQAEIRYPCRLFNDANAGGFAELWASAVLDKVHWAENSMVYLSINNSIGGAFISSGKAFSGVNNRAGEFGHITLYPNGKVCYCGQKGCIDSYLSAQLLAGPFAGKLEEFFIALEERQAMPMQIWDTYLNDLARTVNILRMAFDCDVVIGGYVGSHLEPYLDDVRQRAAKLNTFETDGSYIKPCVFKRESTAVGAALMHIDAFMRDI